MLKKAISLFALIAIVGMVACATPHQKKTSLELQAFQSKEFEADKKTAFGAVMSVFQDLGYVIKSADVETGFINSSSPIDYNAWAFPWPTETNTEATAFIEPRANGMTRVRLNFVEVVVSNGGYGRKDRADTPNEDPKMYQNAFAKIEEGIFVRKATN